MPDGRDAPYQATARTDDDDLSKQSVLHEGQVAEDGPALATDAHYERGMRDLGDDGDRPLVEDALLVKSAMPQKARDSRPGCPDAHLYANNDQPGK